jgi:hypothetical protein
MARRGYFPSLLFNLAPNPRALGVQCVDDFYCVPIGSDKTVRDLDGMETWTLDVWVGGITGDALVDMGDISEAMTSSTAVRRPAPPDAKIHVSFERVASSSDPYLCLAARHNGYMIGAISIRDIMKTLVLSLQVPTSCSREGHTNKTPGQDTASIAVGCKSLAEADRRIPSYEPCHCCQRRSLGNVPCRPSSSGQARRLLGLRVF